MSTLPFHFLFHTLVVTIGSNGTYPVRECNLFTFNTSVVVIGFSGTACSSCTSRICVNEDAGSVSIMLFVQNGALDRDVVITLSTIDGTTICEYKPL